MSTNKTQITDELMDNPLLIDKRINELENEQRLQAELVKSQDKLIRDNAFFKYIATARQLKSNITILNLFEDSVIKPEITHTQPLKSYLEEYDPMDDVRLRNINDYYDAKAEHLNEIMRLNMIQLELTAEIVQNVIPRVLYFLLQYLPFTISIYRYFYPENKFDRTIELGRFLSEKYENTQRDIDEEIERYEEEWQSTQAEYETVTYQQWEKLKNNQILYEQLNQKAQTMHELIQTYPRNELKQAYTNFQNNPTMAQLYHLTEIISQSKLKDSFEGKTDLSQLDMFIHTLQDLYPETGQNLEVYAKKIMNQLSAEQMLHLIKDEGKSILSANKKLKERIQQRQSTYHELEEKKKTLNRLLNYQEIDVINLHMQEIKAYLDRAIPIFQQRSQYTKLLSDFYKSRSGESLINLYRYSSQSDTYSRTARYLKSLYPASIARLEAEQNMELLSLTSAEKYRLLEEYLQHLVSVIKSNDPSVQPYKSLAMGLKQFVNSPTWDNLYQIEQEIKKSPRYHRDQPKLEKMIEELMHISMNSKSLQVPPERKPVPVPASEPTRPNFFQASAKEQSKVNELIKDILGDMNAYRIRYSGNEPNEENKKEILMAIGQNIAEYTEILTKPDAHLSQEHRKLILGINRFIQIVTTQDIDLSNINEQRVGIITSKLEQLGSSHPLNQAVHFIIEVLRSNKAYMQVDTKVAQRKFQKDFNELLDSHKKYMAKAGGSSESHRKWTHIAALKALITEYIRDLDNNKSPTNAEEHASLLALQSQLIKIYEITRYNSHDSKEYNVSNLHDQMHQDMKNLNHPIKNAVERCLEVLEELRTEERLSFRARK